MRYGSGHTSPALAGGAVGLLLALAGCGAAESGSAEQAAAVEATAMEAAPAVQAAGDDEAVLRINSLRGTIDCTGRHVEILARRADLDFTGKCRELYFLGDDTAARIQDAQMVQVVADRVSLQAAGPLDELRLLGSNGEFRAGEITGELYVQGDGNVVDVRSAGEVRLIGARNRVQWQGGQPEIDDLGDGNQLVPGS